MNRVAYRTISLKHSDLVELFRERGIEIIKGTCVSLATYTPHLGEMTRHDAGYITADGELVLTVIADNI